ncbi:MAG: esterase-like activity of phytase family protein [Proteobacteria bacterium]|nr:esterase-like activity of phytase family protein [Pseudomonadota bacterium]
MRLKLRPAPLVLALIALLPALPQALRAQVEKPSDGTAPRAIVTPIQIANLPLGVVTFPNGKAMNLVVSMGSAAFRQPGDVAGRLWFLTDRGPNIACTESKRLLNIDPEQSCAGDRNGRIYPLPGFVPSIYGVDLGADSSSRISIYLPLKTKSGKPISGRPNPPVNGERSEATFSIDGKPLPPDPSGIDPEAIIRLSDGTFWIAEEFGPSLLEVAADGTILRRLVPSNVAPALKDADYEIVPALPPILRQRMTGRGFEGLAVSPDQKHLYAMMQSPLVLPDAEAFRRSRNVRIWKIERESGEIVGQFLYQLDPVTAFRGDHDGRERAQQDVQISEIVAIGEDKLLVVERVDRTTRFFTVSINGGVRIPVEFNQIEANPALEILDGDSLALRGLLPLEKVLVLDSDTVPGLPSRIEGVAVTAPDELYLISDSDFGIDGARTQLVRVTLPVPSLK